MPRGVHGSGPGSPKTSLPRLAGCSPSASLAGSIRFSTAWASSPAGSGSWTMYPVQAGSALSSSTTASTCAWVASSGRSLRMDAIPTWAQSRCLPLTYARLPGSSPTRTVPSPGTVPRAARAATRWVSSARISAARALPSSTCAVTPVPLVVEVPYAGEVQRDTRGLGGRDDQMVADRAARFGDGAHPGLGQDLEAVGEREVRVAGGDRARGPVTGPLHRQAGRIHPVDLTHPDPDRGTAGGQQDGIGFDRTACLPRERQVREHSGVDRLAGFELPVRRIVARLIHPVRGLQQHPAGHHAQFYLGGTIPPRPPLLLGGSLSPQTPSAPRAPEQPDVLARGQDVQGLGVEAGRDYHLGEHVLDLPGQGRGHRPVGRDHPAERRDRT